jgi:endonuclease YncB( thermonuclease family)
VRSAARIAAAALALAFVAAAPNAVLEARVTKVVDGDTLNVRSGGASLRVRLIGIDTPERDQPYARESRQALQALVSGSPIRLETHGEDRFGRILARVLVAGRDVNAELVRRGAAWVYRTHRDDPRLLALEREARAQKRGLWALPESARVPPWEWRHPTGAEGTGHPTRAKAGAAFQCGAKTYCREMASCAEARFHLQECGLARLDGDGDGVPCSSLCKR